MLSLLQSPWLRQYAVVFILNLTVLATGMSLAWPSPVLVKLMNATDTPLYRPITVEEGSWIVSIGFLCSVFANMLLGMLPDLLGRKYCVLLTCVPKIIVSIIFIFVKDVWLLILGRAIIGIADLFLFTVVPFYASEIASKEIRGSIGSFQQTFSSIGIVLTLTIGPFTSYTTYSIVFAGVILVTSVPLLFLPDSPYFLYSKGRTIEAVKTLKYLRGSKKLAEEELVVYATSMNNEKVDKIKLIKDRIFLKSLGVSMVFSAASQLVGFNAVSYYLQTILESTNTKVMPEVASAVIGLIQLLASFCTTLVTNRFNRKHILILTLVGMFIGMLALGVFFKIKENKQEVSGFMHYLPLISLILVVSCYSAVNLSVLTTGMSMAWPSPVLVKLRNTTETPFYRPITEEEGSWMVSVGFLCSIITNLLLGPLLDCMGRKYCVLFTCVPKIFASILFIFAKDVWLMILGRAIFGITDMFLFFIVPVYASEIASKNVRGAICSFQQFFSSLGVVITLSVGPFTSYITFSIVFAAIIIFTSVPLLFLPDSPYFLHSKGKVNEAINVLKFLRGSEEFAKEELAVYATSTSNEKVDKMKLLKDRVVLKSLGICLVLCAASQLVGFNAVSFYLQTILESTKTNVMPELASVVIGLIQLLASFCTILVTNRFKRKHILISSLVGMLLGMIGLGVFFKIRETTLEVSGFMNYLPLISLILVVYCFSAGIGSILWPIVAELFDGPARAVGVTTSSTTTSLFLFLTTKYFATLSLIIGPTPIYWFFSGACIVTCFFIYYCIPETIGKSFDEIQKALSGEENKSDMEKR